MSKILFRSFCINYFRRERELIDRENYIERVKEILDNFFVLLNIIYEVYKSKIEIKNVNV